MRYQEPRFPVKPTCVWSWYISDKGRIVINLRKEALALERLAGGEYLAFKIPDFGGKNVALRFGDITIANGYVNTRTGDYRTNSITMGKRRSFKAGETYEVRVSEKSPPNSTPEYKDLPKGRHLVYFYQAPYAAKANNSRVFTVGALRDLEAFVRRIEVPEVSKADGPKMGEPQASICDIQPGGRVQSELASSSYSR